MAILDIHQLTMRFGGLTAVNALDLAIPEREIVSVIGQRRVGMALFDPSAGLDFPWEPDGAVVAYHDNKNVLGEQRFAFTPKGGSWLTFSFPDAQRLEAARFEVERLIGPTDSKSGIGQLEAERIKGPSANG